MKKLLTFALCLLLMTGCASETTYTSQVTNGSDVIASVGNASITRQDLYNELMSNSGVNYVIDAVLSEIAGSVEVDEEAINAEVANTETTWKSMFGENIDATVEAYFGYKTFEEYKTKVLIPSLRQGYMIENYIEENFTTLADSYMFVKVGGVIVDDESTALEVITKISTQEMTFEDALVQYSTDASNISNKGVIGLASDLESCTVDSSIIAILPQLKFEGTYSMPLQLSTGKYLALYILETDIEVLHDDILSALQADDKIVQKAEAHYLTTNGFTVEDSYLKEEIKTLYPAYIK